MLQLDAIEFFERMLLEVMIVYDYMRSVHWHLLSITYKRLPVVFLSLADFRFVRLVGRTDYWLSNGTSNPRTSL